MVVPECKLLPAITHEGTDAVCELHGLLQTVSGTVQDIQVYMVGMLYWSVQVSICGHEGEPSVLQDGSEEFPNTQS